MNDNDEKVIFTRTDAGRIVLDMPLADWEELLMLLGQRCGMALSQHDQILFTRIRQFANHLNENNPAWEKIEEDVAAADEDGPKYWKNESSGVLAPVVKKYLDGKTLDRNEISIMKAYLYQWVAHPTWKSCGGAVQTLALQVMSIQTKADLVQCMKNAEALGIDPL